MRRSPVDRLNDWAVSLIKQSLKVFFILGGSKYV